MTLSVRVEYYRLTYILWVIDHIQPAIAERQGPWASCLLIRQFLYFIRINLVFFRVILAVFSLLLSHLTLDLDQTMQVSGI